MQCQPASTKHPHLLPGPTAVGETEWALRWAEAHGAEVLSCDSLLFYRGMDLGTAKPTPAERARVPHHLIDVCAPGEPMDIGRYVAAARAVVDDLTRRGRAILVCGGSGFYLRAFLGPVVDTIQVSPELRAEVARLEELLRLPPLRDHRLEHARVARRDFSGWWQRIVIRKGRDHGIPAGAPVVFSGGVVGRVSEVHATTAVVELISSPTMRLAGVVEGDTRPISFQGGVNPTLAPPRGVVELMPLDIIANPAAPKRLVTAGFGGVFPPGLTLGTIVRADLASDGLFKSGEVALDPRLGTLTEVSVLVPAEYTELAVRALHTAYGLDG